MIEPFLLRALLAGALLAVLTAPLGCFIVWRRMAYFGDTLSHAALLGVALGFLFHIDLILAVTLVGAALALALYALEKKPDLSADTLLGVLSHASLAFGLIAVSFLEKIRFDLMGYLFGDILAVTWPDLALMAAATLLISLAWLKLWRPLLALTVSADIARIEGLPVEKTRLTFMLILALVIALAMKLVGVLLITALLIIPAAAARAAAKTPEQMAFFALLAGLLAVAGGLTTSYIADLPAGAAIVAAAALLFTLSRLKK